MELIIDTNCLISALIVNGKSRELICSLQLLLFAPEQIIDETLHHEKEIMDKSGISESDFNLAMNIFLSTIKIVPEEEFRGYREKALLLVTHPEDSPFMALAISKNIPIWSDDKGFKKQAEIKVISTTELITLLKE